MPKKNTVLYPTEVIQAMNLNESPLAPDDPAFTWRSLAEGIPGSPSAPSRRPTCCTS